MIDEMNTSENSTLLPQARKLIDSDNLQSLATNAALILLCVIASLVSFWDIQLTFDSAFSIGWVTVLLYIVSTTVYQTKYDGGIFKGKQTDVYKAALDSFDSLRKRIMDTRQTDALRDWCNDYRIKDVESIRKNIVCPYMSYDTYLELYANRSKAHVKQAGLSRKARKAVNLANSVEPVDLTSDMLLNLSHQRRLLKKRRLLPRSGDEQRTGDLAATYIKKFFITFICGMFVVEIINNPTLDTFLQWLIRMVPIVMAFLTGPGAGFRNASEVSVKRMHAQSKLLTVFFADSAEQAHNEKEKALPSDAS
jgi:hypothetical protein